MTTDPRPTFDVATAREVAWYENGTAMREWLFDACVVIEELKTKVAELEAERKLSHHVALYEALEIVKAERDQLKARVSVERALTTFHCHTVKLLREELDQLKAQLAAARLWLEADDEWEKMMPDDWSTSKEAYRAREAFRKSLETATK